RNDAGVERQGLLDRRASLHRRPGGRAVAARAQRAAFGAHAVDQAAVEVADLAAEPPLAVEPGLGFGRLEARQIEDADVDRGERDARLFAHGEPGQTHWHRERRARLHLLRHGELYAQRARSLLDLEPAQAERAARHALGLGIERAIERDRNVGPGAQLRADG